MLVALLRETLTLYLQCPQKQWENGESLVAVCVSCPFSSLACSILQHTTVSPLLGQVRQCVFPPKARSIQKLYCPRQKDVQTCFHALTMGAGVEEEGY